MGDTWFDLQVAVRDDDLTQFLRLYPIHVNKFTELVRLANRHGRVNVLRELLTRGPLDDTFLRDLIVGGFGDFRMTPLERAAHLSVLRVLEPYVHAEVLNTNVGVRFLLDRMMEYGVNLATILQIVRMGARKKLLSERFIDGTYTMGPYTTQLNKRVVEVELRILMIDIVATYLPTQKRVFRIPKDLWRRVLVMLAAPEEAS